MRHHPTTLPLALFPLLLPALAAEEAPANAVQEAGSCAQEIQHAASVVDSTLRELGAEAEAAPVTTAPEATMPEARRGQSVAVSDGGLFFDAANSRIVYLRNVRLNDERVKLCAANRLYIQLPKEKTEADAGAAAKEAINPTQAASAPKQKATAAGEKPKSEFSTENLPTATVDIITCDALVDTVNNRMVFTSGPGAETLIFRQGCNEIVVQQAEGKAATALADEQGNILLEGADIRMQWLADDGTLSTFRSTGGRVLYHAASRAIVMEGPVDASYKDGESTLSCSGPLCVTLKPEENAAPRKNTFMGQFAAMRFTGIAAASATGNVQLSSRLSGQGMALSGDALYYNGLTGEVEVPGSPCIITYGEKGNNSLQTVGSLVLTADGDIHFKGKGLIEGIYERPSRTKGAAPLQGTLSAMAPLSFHAANGTITTRALSCRDAEASFSCTGEVHLALTPRTAEELAEAKLPPREKVGMLNLALARYNGINSVKAVGRVRAQLLDPAAPTAEEASLSASELVADLVTGEILLTGAGETAAIAFRNYALSGTADALTPASVHLKRNGDIEARGAQVACTIPSKKGLTTLNCADRVLLAREQRSLSLGAATRIQSPDGILTTNGPMQAVLAASAEPEKAKPLSPRYPHLVYAFSGLESAETFEGASVRAAQGSLQCSQHLSILMQPQGSTANNQLGGIRSAIATGRVLVAAKDATGRMLRATGDRLVVDGNTGEKRLTGSRVVLEDARNRHEASGEGAAVLIDARNNARITGERHTTSATNIRGQVEERKTTIQDNKTN